MKLNQSFKIRATKKADVPDVIELIRKNISPKDAERAESIFSQYFQPSKRSPGRGEFYVAALKGSVVGTSGYYRIGNSYWLGWFAVNPKCRGLGVGSALLERVEKAVMSKGARELFVYTSPLPQFKKAGEFYKRKGFEEVSGVDHPRLEDDMLFLRKRLFLCSAR